MSASDFWDREVIEQQYSTWMGIPEIRVYINRLIGAGEMLWPIELFERVLQGRRFHRALSIGCGSGALERELIHRGLCKRVDAFDGSTVSLREARKQADQAGFGGSIGYFAADFNRPAFPTSKFDLVLFHQSAHHVLNLERLYRAILLAMVPDGVLYLDEYIGPSRFEWLKRPKLLVAHNTVFAQIPTEIRASPVLPPPVQIDDPSEAVRSSEIEPLLRIGFEVITRRPYGCGLLSVILPQLRPSRLTPSLLNELIERDRDAPPYYAIFVARPKKGFGRWQALARYRWAARLRRVARGALRIGEIRR